MHVYRSNLNAYEAIDHCPLYQGNIMHLPLHHKMILSQYRKKISTLFLVELHIYVSFRIGPQEISHKNPSLPLSELSDFTSSCDGSRSASSLSASWRHGLVNPPIQGVLNLTGNSYFNISTRFKHWMILECFSQEGKSSKMHKKQSWMIALSQVAFTSFSLDLKIRLTWHSWLTYLVSCANWLPPVAISKLLFHMASSSSLRADCTSRSLTSPVRCWEWLTLTNYCSTNCCVAFSFAQLVVVLAGLNSFGLNVDLLILGPTEFVLRNPSHLQQPLPCSSAYPHSKQIWVLCHRCCIIGGWSSGSILAGLEETPTKAAELVFSKAVGTLLPKYICLWSWRQSNGMQRKCKDSRSWYRFLNQ